MKFNGRKIPTPISKTLGFRDDPRFRRVLAPIGSVPWAEQSRENMQDAVRKEANTVISFTTEMGRFVELLGWNLLTDEDGQPFQSFRTFARAKNPHGLGCSEQQLAVMVRRTQKTVADSALEAKAIAKNGEVGNGRSRCSDTTATFGRGADYLTARIKRDRPDILERMKAGEFSSVRQAAKEAGIVRERISIALDPVNPVKIAETLFRHFSLREAEAARDRLSDLIAEAKVKQ
jgi:hypothetical protein